MAEPFLGEIKMVGFNFSPRGWAFCDGQLLPIAQNQALFSLLGTHYGGNGQTTFALPDLRGRTPVHPGNGIALGQAAGTETVTLTQNEMPAHNHTWNASAAFANRFAPTPNNLIGVVPEANQGTGQIFSTPTNLVPMAPEGVLPTGGNQPHPNMQPYLVLNFCIALQGIFPSRN